MSESLSPEARAIDNLAQKLLIDAKDRAEQARLVEQHVLELEQLFEMRMAADRRGIKMWQEKTGRTLIHPDHGDLTCWLIGELDEACAAAQRNAEDRNKAVDQGSRVIQALRSRIAELEKFLKEIRRFG